MVHRYVYCVASECEQFKMFTCLESRRILRFAHISHVFSMCLEQVNKKFFELKKCVEYRVAIKPRRQDRDDLLH